MAAAGPPEESSLAPSPLTQTQPIAAPTQGTQIGSPNQDLDVYARLISLIDPSAKLELRASSTQVHIGRHTECDIQVGDKRVSARHLRIYRDDAFRYFVETLSSNGCFVNEHFMQKGDTRALKHGDELSIGVSALSAGGSKPFAAYIFMVADHRRELGNGVSASSREASTGSNGAAAGGASGSSRPNKLVTEQWVQSQWDIRIMLGSGNFSEVHLGVEVKTGEKWAVKVIDVGKFQQFQSKRESQLSLVSEAELLTSLKHDNIVCFREWFQTDSKLYLVMEFMEGGDLLQSILDDGHFAELQARRLFKRVCEAVQYLHSMGVVHRDLKPENILLTSRDREKGEPKIADFGLARKNLQSRDCKTFCGTPHYFAPEVINTFRERETGRAVGYGKTVDMWSLGVILYILLSGIPPFEEDGLYEQILDGKYEFDVQEWRLVSPEAKELVRGLMTVNPKERLTIQQALEGRWLRLASGPSTSFEREVPMGGEPASKRLRAGESATIGTGAASSTSPPEL